MGLSIFEWIAEKFNPGPVGTVNHANDDDSWQPRSKLLVWFLTLIGLGIFGFFIWCIIDSGHLWQGTLILVAYLFIAFMLSPKPEHQNMGWLGGVLDNPFRISDDFNRFLFFFALFLLPGKIVLYSLQTIINTIRIL